MLFILHKTILSLLLVLFSNISVKTISFFQEEIHIIIHEKSCIVKGKYFFKNEGKADVATTIYFPFYIDEFSLYPDSITVKDLITEKNLPYENMKNGIAFAINVPEESIFILEVIYWQKLLSNRLEYILTTTKRWGKPFEIAKYTIEIPSIYPIKYISFDYNKYFKSDGIIVISIERKNFFPKKNLIVEWEE